MKIDRLIGILSILLQKDQVTAPELAETFEVSRRTINRDIDTLSRAGIPIRTSQGKNGGIAIMAGYRIERALLTSGEMQAILTGLRSLDSVSGTNRYAQLMEKMRAGASSMLPGDSHILIDLASWYKTSLSQKIEIIHGAIGRRCTVRFHYASPGGESDREIEPAYLIFRWSNWYVWGWCRQKQAVRLFKLNRMTDVRPGESFMPRELGMPDLSNERVFPTNYQVKARVAAKYKWRLIEEYGSGSFTEQADGTCLFSFGFTDRDSIFSWILSFQGEAELIEPAFFRAELAEIGKILQAAHQKQDKQLS